MTRKEILQSPAYWAERIEIELFRKGLGKKFKRFYVLNINNLTHEDHKVIIETKRKYYSRLRKPKIRRYRKTLPKKPEILNSRFWDIITPDSILVIDIKTPRYFDNLLCSIALNPKLYDYGSTRFDQG